MTYKPYTVVLVPFPFTDSNQTKKRPAIVLSHQEHQVHTNHITLMMITSAKHSAWESDYLISNLRATGLTAPSVVRQKIFTLDVRLIIKSIGKIAEIDKNHIAKKLKKHLPLN